MTEWVDINRPCEHCGKPLEARPDVNHGCSMVLVGFEPMEYRHKHDHSSECIITRKYKAEPYTSCKAYQHYIKLTRETEKVD